MKKKQENLQVNAEKYNAVYHSPVYLHRKLDMVLYKLKLVKKGVVAALEDIAELERDLEMHRANIRNAVKTKNTK